MLNFLSAYAGTLVIGVIVAAVAVLIVVRLLKNRRAGKHSCGCDCGSCHGGCH